MTSFRMGLHLQDSNTKAYSWVGVDFTFFLRKTRDFRLPPSLEDVDKISAASWYRDILRKKPNAGYQVLFVFFGINDKVLVKRQVRTFRLKIGNI